MERSERSDVGALRSPRHPHGAGQNDQQPRSPTSGPGGERANLDDEIVAHVKALIVDGTLLPGQRIVPEQLARDLGVSRTPTLTALKRLAQQGLITWQSRRGVYVRRLSKRELAMIFEVREMLEGLAARRAATHITPEEVGELRDLFGGVEATETPENRRSYMAQDFLFHSRILEIAGSPPLSQTINSVNILALAFGAGLIKSIEHRLSEHETILDAFARHDSEAAEAAMRAHIRESVEWLHQEAELAERERAHIRGMLRDGADG